MLDQRFSVSIHIMTVLAYHEGELMTSDQLASSVRTNPTVVRRLVAKLVDAGLLESYKGKSGGVKISKNPKSISLKEIYLAVSGKQLINTPNKEPLKQCAVSCSMKEILCNFTKGFEANSMSYLSKIKLSDFTAKI